MANELTAQPLTAQGAFNWVFLIEILVVGILALFFLFYFNRLFATIISYAIRFYTWRKFKTYVDISALQISLLGGRLFFKSIRYHGHNITLYVYEGHVTWRYWLRLVQDAEVFLDQDLRASRPDDERPPSNNGSTEKEGKASDRSSSIGKEEHAGARPRKELPCRISVKVAGVEAFIYNRSPLYDTVVQATMGKNKDTASDASGNLGKSATSSSQETDGRSEDRLEGEPRKTTRTATVSAAPADSPRIPSFLRIFPIKVECRKAAAAIGNENTTHIIVAKSEKAGGMVDAGHAGPLDLWQLLFKFTGEKISVAMKPNRDFKEFQLDAAKRLLREKQLGGTSAPPVPIKQAAHKAHDTGSRIWRFFKSNKSSTESVRTASIKSSSFPGRHGHAAVDQLPGQGQWHGLRRYLDDHDLSEHEEWQKVEYAKASQLVDCDKVTMRFYWDMPGPTPEGTLDSDTLLGSTDEDDINGTAPPAYGMDLGVHGGVVAYGPWADRQRINLQHVFFPAPCVDAVPAKPLRAGELRVCTVFKIRVTVEEDVVLRIPTREESKDSKWKGRADKARPAESQKNGEGRNGGRQWRRHGKRRKDKKGPTAGDIRPYGWLDITVKKDAVVNYTMDMFPRPNGYRNKLDVDVKSLEMSSSVNHGLLWRSGRVTVDADISQPSEWNTLRKWPFNVVITDMELFILRDHLFLIIDLVNDWASGAPSDFYTFVPYNYQLELTFQNFVMYLNVNDANIINDPADFDRNDFLTLEGQLHAFLGIPMEHYRPKTNKISFDVLAQHLSMRMISPPKSTFHVFLQDKTMATLPKLTLKGSYTANQDVKVGNVDALRMDLVGTGLTLKAFGFFVRQLINVKENYFGDYMHFKTLEEFQGASDDFQEANAKTASFPKPTSINELDVILCIVAEQATVMLPTNLYSCKEFVRIELPRADLDLRIVSYYLDMGLQLSPISFMTGTSTSEDDDPAEIGSSTQFWVSHLDLNGHRAFGLPPNEDAYVSQWDIDVGRVSGELSGQFTRDLALAGRAFIFAMDDAENALPVVSPAVALDASFVQVRTAEVHLWMHVGKDAMLLDLAPINVDVNGWADGTFSERINVRAPLVTVACVDARSASRHRTQNKRRDPVRTYAFLQTGVSVDVVGRRANFDVETKRQQSHFKLHDQRTGRFPFLVRPDIDATIAPEDDLPFQPPASPYPPMPEPLTAPGNANGAESIKSLGSVSIGRHQLRSKSSASSLSGSIRSGRLSVTAARTGLSTRDTDQSGSRESRSFHFADESSRSSSTVSQRARQSGRLPGDAERAKFGLPSSTMAFSSPYSEPYFPLMTIVPDEGNVPGFSNLNPSDDEVEEAFDEETVVDPSLDTAAEHTSVLIKVVPGIRAYVEPHLAITASKLLSKILPKHPEEIMDYYQMTVMSAIQAQNAARKASHSVLGIHASVSEAHMRVMILDETQTEAKDQVDVNLRSLEIAVRIRSQTSDNEETMQAVALHTTLETLGVSLAERSAGSLAKPALQFNVEDVLLWLALSDTQAFHVSFRDTDVAIATPQAKYLTRLALKLIPVVKDIEDRFRNALDDNLHRMQLFTYVLTRNSDHVADPPFMARMLFILRAFPGHFRNTDSWKIVTRFRYIMQTLPPDVMDQLVQDSTQAKLNCPEDAPVKVLESWTQWRNWDVPYVNQTTAFKMLSGPEELKKLEPFEKKPLTVTFRSEMLRVAIENDAGNSEIILEESSLGVENTPPTKPEGLMLVDENRRRKTLLQMHTGLIAFNLDWALYSIAEDVLALKSEIEDAEIKLKGHRKRTATQALDDTLTRHDIHVVVSTNTGSLSLRTPNVRHLSRVDGMKLSVIGTTQATEQLGQCASVILNVDTAVTELHGPTSRIWQTLLTSPSLYIDHLQAAPHVQIPPTITLAVAYEDLRISVNEQVPGILHLVDVIIAEEVSKVQRLVDAAKASETVSAPASPPLQLVNTVTRTTSVSKTSHGQLPPKLHVAVLAGNIRIEVSLLQELGYQLEGVAASVKVAPSLTKNKVFSIDFDVGRLNHAFVNTSRNERHVQGLLDVPPINGHVGLELHKTETSVSLATTIEKVEVDAGAIQGVLGVINQPEVLDVIQAIKHGVEDIQIHVAQAFPESSEAKRKPVKDQRISFDARLALLGVRVSASTPTSESRGRATAEVEFGIGPLHVTASNRAAQKGANPFIPEVRAYIQDIGASLQIKDRGKLRPCGNATLSIRLYFNNTIKADGTVHRELKIRSVSPEVNAYPNTAAIIVDVINHLQDRIKHLDLSKEVDYLRKLRDERRQTVIRRIKGDQSWHADADEELPFSPEDLLSITTTIELTDIQACWLVDKAFAPTAHSPVVDLIFSIQSVEFTTRGGHEARLTIQDMQLQLAKKKDSKQQRAPNSALLPEVGFSVGYWSEDKKWSLAFKATGKPLDLRLESKFMLPLSAVQRSIEVATDKFKKGTATWESTPTTSGAPRKMPVDTKRIKGVLIEADFAGAQVYMQGTGPRKDTLSSVAAASQQQGARHGRYGQFAAEGALMQTTLTAPGIAVKLEYNSNNGVQPTVNAEIMIDASSNMLSPNVVPLILEVSNSIKDVMQSQPPNRSATPAKSPAALKISKTTQAQKFFEEDNIVQTTPAKIFGKTKVDIGFRIAKQEFGLSCQPIARVDASASLDDFYITMNTIDSDEHGHFFAMSAVMTKLTAQVKHMYSREPTFRYDMDSIVLSLMNNKHLSGNAGISAILNLNPTHIVINGKQFQDLLLFREIWLPPEIRHAGAAQGPAAPAAQSTRADEFVVQRYQSIAAAAAFPWNATVSITKLSIDLDLGQSIGKSSFVIKNLWASQQKSSNWEQNLCIGLDEMTTNSTGRMSGFIQLEKLGVRTSIKWPEQRTEAALRKTPLIQASVGFDKLRAKAAFDYQAFAFGDIEHFDFLMYNVRDADGNSDRLVAVLDCEKAYIFSTSTSPAQAVGLYQAFDRLIQEKQTAYMQSLKDIEKHIRRESTVVPTKFGPEVPDSPIVEKKQKNSLISLHTDVVVTIGDICFGVYPSTFFDSQMLKFEANNIQARFAVGLEKGRITSGLGMTLGQLQVALSSARRITAVPKALEITVEDVINSALNAKGGIILRVPKVVASMQTWQAADSRSNSVDYIFKSLFDGKIDVGWNLSRVDFIKGMYISHTRALASRLGKSLPESAVKITASSSESKETTEGDTSEKITAEINLPQSRYEYHALEPPVIETPQLRDMGEATPPLEWIGLHRDRLPNVTHQIVIVSLLEVCKEVEDAYEKILGSS